MHIWGAIIPIKPMMPTKQTQIAAIKEAKKSPTNLREVVLTPIFLAIFSPPSKALNLQDKARKMTKEMMMTIEAMRFSFIVILSKFPKLQLMTVANCTSSAKYWIRVVIAWKRLDKAIPTRTTVVGEKRLKEEMSKTVPTHNKAIMKAHKETISGLAATITKLAPVPDAKMMAILAPSVAALETPKVVGLAIGFFKQVCMMSPDIASPPPIRRAAKVLGSLTL